MNKYILNGVEFVRDFGDHCFISKDEHEIELTISELLHLGATEAKEDDWEEIEKLNTPSGGFFGEYCKNSSLFKDRKCKQDGKMYEGGVSCSCFDGSEDKENSIVHKVNQLIKNQQYLKRRVDAQKKNE